MGGITHIAAPRCALGEGAAYDAATGELTWVDIPASRAFGWTGSLSARDAARETAFTFRLTEGRMVEGGARGLAIGNQTLIPPGLTEAEALNDGAVHPSGRLLIIGSRDRAESAPTGHAWTLNAQGWGLLDQGFTCFNGPAFSLGAEASVLAAVAEEEKEQKESRKNDAKQKNPAKKKNRYGDAR